MATSVFLSNLTTLTVNAVSLLDQATSVTIDNVFESLDKTAFGSTSRSYTAGLINNKITVTLYNSYAASETYATLASLVGTTTTVVASVTDGAVTKTFTITGAYLETLPVVNGSLGTLSTIDITFTGGVLVAS
ncbi:hypothetical protein UFOVP1208_19 [uncultured Caudovirales phage]|uniref:Uncharacterized protein n=1 Tax=uncultured Caudovirales phage TaxID=2100421 RepID=A0A6J5PVW9_9CAUD|nr:hypothetical protein UFOVP980_4 [uncultured Caudovirales phage]CAB4189752.1 hypothetical protein UFOVP1208_19 [uncultured Caudovirales phage]CAB4194054.1 hypothetical protein UFOVP1263_7 [uncultured Caudovirales phage]